MSFILFTKHSKKEKVGHVDWLKKKVKKACFIFEQVLC